jgi:hypothetical protein
MSNDLPVTLEAEDLALLKAAHHRLEHPSLAARLSNVVGTPIDIALQLMPKSWYRRVHGLAESAIMKALSTATSSMHRDHEPSAHESLYKGLVTGSGAVSGFFGLPGLAVELPITTTLMLRAIAEIARDEGEDIHDEDTRAACVQVFALGGRSELDDAAETGYYGVRLALAGYLGHTVMPAGESVSGLAMFVRAVASRFGMNLSRRAAAQIVPVIGALGAATINAIFVQHFQDMARAHFTVRRLERKYGADLVRNLYESLQRREEVAAGG